VKASKLISNPLYYKRQNVPTHKKKTNKTKTMNQMSGPAQYRIKIQNTNPICKAITALAIAAV